jgi:hypothetical protein
MIGPIAQLVHNKYVANSVLLEISYELAINRVIANPIFSCSGESKKITGGKIKFAHITGGINLFTLYIIIEKHLL